MFDAISLFCLLCSKCVFLFHIIPNVMSSGHLDYIPGHSSLQGEEVRVKRAAFIFPASSLPFTPLLTWSWKRMSVKPEVWSYWKISPSFKLHKYLPLTWQFCIQVVVLWFNLINYERAFGAPKKLRQNPFLFSQPGSHHARKTQR